MQQGLAASDWRAGARVLGHRAQCPRHVDADRRTAGRNYPARVHDVVMAAGHTGGAKFSRLLVRAEENLWTSFEEAREFVQRGDVGDVREDAVARFLRQRLPSRFGVASGEVVDTAGTQSGQTDILIYDGSLTAPLIRGAEGNVLLAAEALLASIEIKSTVTKAEIEKAVRGVGSLHALRPWDAPFGVITGPRGGRPREDLPRILTSIFGYKSDLKKGIGQQPNLRGLGPRARTHPYPSLA